MRNLLSIKSGFVLLWLIPFTLFHTVMVQNQTHGKDHAFSLGIYEKNLPSSDQVDAVMAVREFFEALCEGRIDILRKMMDESLREEHILSFNDPSYPELLKKIYGGSKMIVKHIDRKESGFFIIDAKLITPKSGTNEVRFEIEQEVEKRRGLEPHRFRSFTVKDGQEME